MLNFTRSFFKQSSTASNGLLNVQNGDLRNRRVRINREIGMWLYKAATMKNFMRWCTEQNVKARGKVRITTAQDYARCIRTTRTIFPGEAVVTAPLDSSVNLLVISRLMSGKDSHQFPLEINWGNWNERLRFLPGASTADLVSAAWLARMAAIDDPFLGPYATWLLEDTTGRDGIANGVQQERGDENHQFDEVITAMAFDSGEEAEDFIEMVFRAIASFMLRATPVDSRVVNLQLPGTAMQKSIDKNELFVPTLIPLVDCCPQRDDGMHSALVEYFTADELHSAGRGGSNLCKELGIKLEEVDERVIGDRGMFALRAIEEMEEGAFVTLRGWPKTGNKSSTDNEMIQSKLIDITRMQNNDLL